MIINDQPSEISQDKICEKCYETDKGDPIDEFFIAEMKFGLEKFAVLIFVRQQKLTLVT